MEAVAYSNVRKNFKAYLQQVNDNAEPIIVTTKDIEDTAVLISKRDFDAMEETLRVLSNQYLMDKIQKGDAQFESGSFKTHELIEADEDD